MLHWFQPANNALNVVLLDNGEPTANLTAVADKALATFTRVEQRNLRDYFATATEQELGELAEHLEECENELIAEFLDYVTEPKNH